MKKKSGIFLLTILLLLEIANAQYLPFYGNKKSSNALSMMELKGKVKSVEQTVFIAKDSLGKVIKVERKFEINGSVNTDFLIQFDMAGRSIKENYAQKEYALEVYHQYDSIKNTETIEEHPSTYKPGKISRRTVYKYNTAGNIIQVDQSQFYRDNSPSYSQKSIFKYDAKSNLIERGQFFPDQKPLKTIYKNDSKGNMVSFTTYGEAGKIWGKETFKIDANGNVNDHAYYIVDTNIVEHSFAFKYDKNKNMIQKDYFKPGVKSTKYTYTYEYDKKENWVKKIDFENGKAVLITERKLEYY